MREGRECDEQGDEDHVEDEGREGHSGLELERVRTRDDDQIRRRDASGLGVACSPIEDDELRGYRVEGRDQERREPDDRRHDG